MSDPVRVAIHNRLLASPGVTSLLGTPTSIYHRRAPGGAKPPLVVYDKRSGVPNYSFGGQPVDRTLWIVRGVAFARTADRAEDIGAAIDAALTDAPLTIFGRHLLEICRESDVNYVEQVGKEQFQHVGAMFRVLTQPS